MSKEFKIGLITIVAGALLYYGFNYLRGSDLLSPTNRYYVTYPNVTGLTVSNPVYFNGLPVGRVSGFQLQQTRSRIVVSLDIDKTFRISEDAVAQLANDGLLGSKAIILVFDEALEILSPGDTLISETDGGLLDRFDPAIDNINTTIASLNDVLAQLKETDIKGTVESLKSTLDILGQKTAEIEVKEPVENINALTKSLTERSEQLSALLDESTALVKNLNQVPLSETLENVSASLEEVNKLLLVVQSEEGTVGKLLKNDSVYNSLNQLLIDLDKLAVHFNEYPKDFMAPLGRKKKKLKGVTQED